ncbi:unnamed protein product [Mesocestoides corti]|uniref:Uncharacterized protein n=1 Tax=Mesocestoides corti TaxID=53468 RepID=A0A0R3U2D1_MESCO|nr:unnamed protein product [Mesocestoides corti]
MMKHHKGGFRDRIRRWHIRGRPIHCHVASNSTVVTVDFSFLLPSRSRPTGGGEPINAHHRPFLLFVVVRPFSPHSRPLLSPPLDHPPTHHLGSANAHERPPTSMRPCALRLQLPLRTGRASVASLSPVRPLLPTRAQPRDHTLPQPVEFIDESTERACVVQWVIDISIVSWPPYRFIQLLRRLGIHFLRFMSERVRPRYGSQVPLRSQISTAVSPQHTWMHLPRFEIGQVSVTQARPTALPSKSPLAPWLRRLSGWAGTPSAVSIISVTHLNLAPPPRLLYGFSAIQKRGVEQLGLSIELCGRASSGPSRITRHFKSTLSRPTCSGVILTKSDATFQFAACVERKAEGFRLLVARTRRTGTVCVPRYTQRVQQQRPSWVAVFTRCLPFEVVTVIHPHASLLTTCHFSVRRAVCLPNPPPPTLLLPGIISSPLPSSLPPPTPTASSPAFGID